MMRRVCRQGWHAAIGAAIVFHAGAVPADPQAAAEFYKSGGNAGNILPVGTSPPVTDDLIKHGGWLYRGLCVRCHGAKGDGEGADWKLTKYDPEHWLPRQPRDFSDPAFKLRSTPSGSMPIDADLFESISRGLQPERDMPSFKFLPERDRWALIAYIKTFSKRWIEEQAKPPIAIADPPMPTAELIAAGKGVYEAQRCARCHGEGGKGDGINAHELKDDYGLPIVPRDFTDVARFLGPSDPRGIYRTFSTGLDGSPMPSFAATIDEASRWQLVWYVTSLRPDFDLARAQREWQRNAAARSGVGRGPSPATSK